MTLYSKRKELWLFIFSVLVLGIEVGIIANIIFSKFYEINKSLFISVALLIVLITIGILIWVMFRYDKKLFISRMLFAYDKENKLFVDIPHSPPSVRARILFNRYKILFNNQNAKNQNNFKLYSEQGEDFINNAVAQIILSRFIKHRELYKEKVNRERLKDVLVKYKYIDIDDILGGEEYEKMSSIELTLPKGFMIVPTDNKSIKIVSKYGFLTFKWVFGYRDGSWTIGDYGNGISYTKLLSAFDKTEISDCTEVQIKVELEYGFNPIKLFMKNTVEFNNFIDRCIACMEDFDIDRSKEKFNSEVFSNMAKFLEKKFNSLKQ
ncbi:hypothetical protein JR311_00080 [Bacillus velezensis]|uniref:hypothetical protein n=1 Tax=Bacillus velezensis TaxID=492670 RepID=UPI001958A563|nr:hypothetical protein [Bacillus velezensis]QRV09415.1 hypothetical protein JR311_00080 [Bacillus velezensis]